MKNKFIGIIFKIVCSRWYWVGMIVLLTLLIMPANSPIPIPADYKVIPATFFVLALVELIFDKDK